MLNQRWLPVSYNNRNRQGGLIVAGAVVGGIIVGTHYIQNWNARESSPETSSNVPGTNRLTTATTLAARAIATTATAQEAKQSTTEPTPAGDGKSHVANKKVFQ